MVSLTLENPMLKNLGSVAKRAPQVRGDRPLPEGTRLISADSHWEISEDIGQKYFPEHLKHKAPKFWKNGNFPFFGDQVIKVDNSDPNGTQRALDFLASALGEGAWNLDVRNEQITAEGIEKEILYPNSLLAFIRHPDIEIQEHVYRAYNEHVSDICAQYPDRYYGVGVCSNWWDPKKAADAIKQIVDLGFKTFMLPTSNPGKTANGMNISYGDSVMDIFWAEAAAAGLPVCFHVGENVAIGQRGSIGASILETFSPFRKPFGQLVFGGVFDSHPNLKVVFAEAGIAWVPPALQDAEAIMDAHYTSLDYKPKRRPTDYWRDNCYATFMNDALGLSQLQYIGVDNVMWSTDYPHNESTLGIGWDSAFAVIDQIGEEKAKKVLGQNAIDLYGLDD